MLGLKGLAKVSWWAGLLNLPLAAVLGYALMRLWLPLPSSVGLVISDTNQAVAKASPSLPTTTQQLDMRSVLEANLFGQASRANAAKAVEAASIQAPETKLQLTLQGTLLTGDGQDSKAIIAPLNGEGKEYLAGELVPGGAKLQDIHADKVILEHQKQLETLSLVNEKAKAGVKMTSSSTAVSALPPVAVSNTDQNLSQSLQQYRQRIMNNPAEMNKLVRINPLTQEGRFVGYTLHPGSEAELFKQAGLQAGDILTHLNGSALDSSMKGLSALQELATSSFLDLQVLRNGTPVQLSFSLQ